MKYKYCFQIDWRSFDPMVDDVEFKGSVFQLAYQYLNRLDTKQDLDGFEFTEGSTEGTPEEFLETLLK